MSCRALPFALRRPLWLGLVCIAWCQVPSATRADEPLYLPPAPDNAVSVDAAAVAPVQPVPPLDSPLAIPPQSVEPPSYQPGVRYWVVSSRNSPQEISQIHCGHLCVYERRCDGSLCPSGLGHLQAQLQPGVPVLLFLHGSYVSWEDNLVQAEGTYQWIRCACPGRPLNVIFFTWPSERERCLLAGCELRRQGLEAETNAFYVSSLLSCVPDCHPVCLLGHSYGARMAMATMHLAGGGSLQGCRLGGSVGGKRIRVILAAAALDHNWLNSGGRYECALCRTECVLNLRNRHDLVLKLYPLLRPLTSHRALGASGVTWFDRRRQECTCRIENFDVTGIVPGSHFWPMYYETPQLASMIAPWVYFPEVNSGYTSAMPVAQTDAAMMLDATTTLDDPDAEPVSVTMDGLAQANSPPTAPSRAAGSTMRTAAPATSRSATGSYSRSTSVSQPRLLQWFRNRGE